MGSSPVGVTTSWGYSSAGRARALQARGHRFEPCCPHHIKKRATLCVVLFLCVGKQHRARTQPNGWRTENACVFLRYAPCVTLQTLCVALLFILDLHYAEHALLSHVINCAFDQTNAFYLFVCLLLVYSFSPRVHSIPRGPQNIAQTIVYAQRFVASNNATHSCDKSHNRWLCPLRSISANASACFSRHLRSAPW